jgi:flagellar hook-length control protein FliK
MELKAISTEKVSPPGKVRPKKPDGEKFEQELRQQIEKKTTETTSNLGEARENRPNVELSKPDHQENQLIEAAITLSDPQLSGSWMLAGLAAVSSNANPFLPGPGATLPVFSAPTTNGTVEPKVQNSAPFLNTSIFNNVKIAGGIVQIINPTATTQPGREFLQDGQFTENWLNIRGFLRPSGPQPNSATNPIVQASNGTVVVEAEQKQQINTLASALNATSLETKIVALSEPKVATMTMTPQSTPGSTMGQQHLSDLPGTIAVERPETSPETSPESPTEPSWNHEADTPQPDSSSEEFLNREESNEHRHENFEHKRIDKGDLVTKSETQPIERLSHSDRIRVANQTVAQIERMAATSVRNEVRMTLEPADLGSIVIEIKREADVLNAALTASNEQVQDSLKESRNDLAASLRDRGFREVKIEVNASQESNNYSNNNESGRFQQQQQQQNASKSTVFSSVLLDHAEQEPDSVRYVRANALVDMEA